MSLQEKEPQLMNLNLISNLETKNCTMDWLSLNKVPGNPPRRTSTRSLPILKAGVDSQYRHTFQKAQPSKVPLKHILRTDARLLPSSIIHPNTRSDGSQLLECGEKKEKVWLSDVFTRVESVGRALASKRNNELPSIGRCNLVGLSTKGDPGKSWIPKNPKGNIYQDWRGIVISDTTVPYTMLKNEQHLARLKEITKKKRSKEMLLLQIDKAEKQQHGLQKQQRKAPRRRKHVNIINEKVKRIGPHLDIFEAFKKLRKVPTVEKIASAATCIQKLFKGWYERSKLKRIKLKAKNHGPNILAVIKDYRRMMSRIKRRCGILDTSTALIFEQLEDWLDNKMLYETIFLKKAIWKEMDRNELPKFFRDCGRFPTQKEINTATTLLLQDSGVRNISLNKNQVVEIAFMLYPPVGLKLITAAAPRSTWVKPIVDGEDSYMYLARGHPVLKSADIRIAGALVAASIRERKKKEQMKEEGLNVLEESD
ncbi:IQ domain-containing protein M isoform X1 [Pantherophis guttatus]|uniref:IQ domain-containing protein M isoform X1 n=2 Tax=Pantherophis guttatus TaxID=94885 RepID=A0ABM3Z3D3_PANGU|nr:IQ domain-containing protein M isoform X1 [Pantherophis guttatus]